MVIKRGMEDILRERNRNERKDGVRIKKRIEGKRDGLYGSKESLVKEKNFLEINVIVVML